MDVLIFNSGYGSRISRLVKNSHKSLLEINGETLLTRQLRILSSFKINKVIITTGPNAEMLIDEVKEKKYPFEIVFINNPIYDVTNYIYSMHLARNELTSDVIMLHGDLVFNKNIVEKLISSGDDSVLIDKEKNRYSKDFKASLRGEFIDQISTNMPSFDVGLQPMYYLKSGSISLWKSIVGEYISNGNNQVYAEDALNSLLRERKIMLNGVYIDEDYCQEIDDEKDYKRVISEVKEHDYVQEVFNGPFEEVLKQVLDPSCPIVVSTFRSMKKQIEKRLTYFANILYVCYEKPNPEKKDIERYISTIKSFDPGVIISVGGGSAIDYSKCLIDFAGLNCSHIAVPTTCGTGSESTTFAVYYLDKIKQSLDKDYLIPDTVIFDNSLFDKLPYNILVSSTLDAFSQAIESYWSIRASSQSKEYSIKALEILYPILKNGLVNTRENINLLQKASNLAGKAINLTTTTAPHALSYNLTKLFDIPHGFAVCMSLPFVWDAHESNLKDFRSKMVDVINILEGRNKSIKEALIKIFSKYNLWSGFKYQKSDLDYLVDNVNIERLGNNPYRLTKSEIRSIYVSLLSHK